MLKLNYKSFHKYIFFLVLVPINTDFFSYLDASAAHTLLRASSKHIPNLIVQADVNSKEKIYPPFFYVTANSQLIKPTKEKSSLTHIDYKKEVCCIEPSGYEFDTEIQALHQKFKNETELFTAKLSEFLITLEDKFDELTLKILDKKTDESTRSKTKDSLDQQLTRDQALIKIKNVVEKVFDPNDQRPLSVYLQEAIVLSQYLDRQTDKQIIEGLQFLQENQHKTSLVWDTIFWMQAIQEKKLNEIPTKLNLKQIPKEIVIAELVKKSKLE